MGSKSPPKPFDSQGDSTTQSSDFRHQPVLLQAVLEHAPSNPKNLVDATLGGAGHALALLEQFPQAHLFGCDRDPEALVAAKERLSAHSARVSFSHLPFSQLAMWLEGGVEAQPLEPVAGQVDYLLADLGVSSPQLDVGERGFSFTRDGPLDMRMDPSSPTITAETLVNTGSREKLLDILRRFGEERFATRIVYAIEAARPIATTGELARVVSGAVPARHHRRGHHPATRTFQALRMEVNDELGELQNLLDTALPLLAPGGRLAIISFHSLEDRMVKTQFQSWEKPCTCAPSMPRCICGLEPLGHRVTRKPAIADSTEQAQNPRSRSAKLRVFEKL